MSVVNAFPSQLGAFRLPTILAEWHWHSREHFLDNVPPWAFFFFVVLIALLPIEAGQRCGARRRNTTQRESVGPVGNVVGATLALLGFMVALTVGGANSRFDARKAALIEGVNAIETAFRNASLVPEPHSSETRKLLREYVAIRLEMPKYFGDPERLRNLEVQVRTLQQALWSHVQALVKEDPGSKLHVFFAGSINDVIEIHNKRVILGASYRIPWAIWVVLLIVTAICMFGVGFLFGLSGNRSPIACVLLVLTFSVVMTLIFDLDQPGEGLIEVNQKPMYDLYERIRAPE